MTYLSGVGDSSVFAEGWSERPGPRRISSPVEAVRLDTNDTQAATPWALGPSCNNVYVLPQQCVLQHEVLRYGGTPIWWYYKGINEIALRAHRRYELAVAGIVYADFPNPGTNPRITTTKRRVYSGS